MEASTPTKKKDEPQPSDALAPDAAEALGEVANTGQLDGDAETQEKKEIAALDYLLGPTMALQFDVPVYVETPDGQAKLTWRISQMDGKRFPVLEKRFTAEAKNPLMQGEVDAERYAAAVIAEATVRITDETGKSTTLDERFRGDLDDPVDALMTRFKYQLGILDQLSGEIQRVSGYSRRVGVAEKVTVRAVGD